MDNAELEAIRRKKDRHRNLILLYLSICDIIPEILRETFFSDYKIIRVFDTDKQTIKSIVIYFDDACRMSVSDYFVCAVRVGDKRKKRAKKTTAFLRSKNLEADIRRALYELDFLE